MLLNPSDLDRWLTISVTGLSDTDIMYITDAAGILLNAALLYIQILLTDHILMGLASAFCWLQSTYAGQK